MNIQDQHGTNLPPPYVPSFEIATAASHPTSSFENESSSIPIAAVASVYDWNEYDKRQCSNSRTTNLGCSSTVARTAPPVSASSNPPRNCPDGGQWGKVNYTGTKTGALACVGVVVCGLPGLFILGCPQDSKDAYVCEDKVYDAAGTLIGARSRVRFVPSRHHYH
jgi:hypothetical protein